MGNKFQPGTPEDTLVFRCPGCNELHVVKVAPAGNRWGWNLSEDMPTFWPSLLLQGYRYPGKEHDAEFRAIQAQGSDALFASRFRTVCHSMIQDGKMQFLADCTHALVGQTVEITDWDAPWMRAQHEEES